MKASETKAWAFTVAPTDDCDVRCRECGEFSPLTEWEEGSVDCECCGDHDAMVCPACGECEDHVYSSYRPMEVRIATET